MWEVFTSVAATGFAAFFFLTFAAWRRYVWVGEKASHGQVDSCPHSLSDVFDGQEFLNVPHQNGTRWLTEFSVAQPRSFRI